MELIFKRRRYILLWQALVLLLGTTWLWAPHLNTHLSYRTSLVSQYELPGQPYAWLFRTGDFLTGCLVGLAGATLLKSAKPKLLAWLLLIVGAGMALDPLLSTTCRMVGSSCREYFSLDFLLHAIETTTTSVVFFVIGVCDAKLRKKLVSICFALFQALYGILFISQFASQEHFNTVTQFIYETILIAWLAWFGRDIFREDNFAPRAGEAALVKNLAAGWAFFNGILAILISLAHIHLLGRIKGLYFAGDSAWLAQHGVIVGVIMLYLSRHLARGERRARQVFLAITGIETLKYSLISPKPVLMMLYLLTFAALFIFRDDFDRGVVALTWRVRLRDLYVMLSGLLLAALAALISLDRDSRVAVITGQTFDHFTDYISGAVRVPRSHTKALLLADTISVFIAAGAAAVLWILFRPSPTRRGAGRHYSRVRAALEKHSSSSEDFFKLWPPDKDYFWRGGEFIAYKRAGPVVFAAADPIGASRQPIIEQFAGWARSHRLKVCFLPVYEGSAALYQTAGLELMQIGSSAVINIGHFLEETAKDKWWRWKRNRAEKGGYIYGTSAPPHPSAFLRQLRRVSDAWLAVGGHAEHGFVMGYFDKQYLNRCTIHYLKDSAGKVLAFTNELPQFNKKTTVTIDLLRYLPDYNDAMPYLIYKTIERAGEDKSSRYFDLGFVPFAKAKGPVLAIAQALGGSRFSSQGLEQFKNKFDPDWQPNYIAYEGDLADVALIALYLEKAMSAET